MDTCPCSTCEKLLQPYLDDPELVKDLDMTPYRVEFLEYTWSVNGVPPKED